ncbi:hypothetical protein XENOCAPTIV_016082 [Xenoophorus captivus]|uniref:Uncharacterized protein n=1 Tax=Xenoophorus captivus TaxID=1517983 RepID=A0ABV0QSY3_9TELE
MSSRTDFKLGNLLEGFTSVHCNPNETCYYCLHCSSQNDSPPGHIGLHHLHHSYGGLVDFNKGPTEDLPQPHYLDHLHHFGADTFNPNKTEHQGFTKKAPRDTFFHYIPPWVRP